MLWGWPIGLMPKKNKEKWTWSLGLHRSIPKKTCTSYSFRTGNIICLETDLMMVIFSCNLSVHMFWDQLWQSLEQSRLSLHILRIFDCLIVVPCFVQLFADDLYTQRLVPAHCWTHNRLLANDWVNACTSKIGCISNRDWKARNALEVMSSLRF